MKREIQFYMNEEKYYFVEEGKTIFWIDIKSLQFDTREFYIGFYSNNKEYQEIELSNTVQDDKKADYIFGIVKKMIDEINIRICEEEKVLQ